MSLVDPFRSHVSISLFFCQLGSRISLPWVIYFEAFYLHVVSSFSCIPVICPKLMLFLTPLQFVHYCRDLQTHKWITINRLMPNDPYMGRTAPLTSKHCILHIYSTNIGTEYFKHTLYSPLSSLQNAVCFIMLTYLVPVLFTFYIQGVIKLKKNNSGVKGLR